MPKYFDPLDLAAKPLGGEGLLSYRCNGAFGWIMIGAVDDDDAMVQARRSSADAQRNDLQKWNGEAYVPCAMPEERKVPDCTDYAYFVLFRPGQKDRTAFVRMKRESIDAEWEEMCADRLRTYPCEVFHRYQAGRVPIYEHVTLSWLKKLDSATAVDVESEWNSRNRPQACHTSAKSERPRLRF